MAMVQINPVVSFLTATNLGEMTTRLYALGLPEIALAAEMLPQMGIQGSETLAAQLPPESPTFTNSTIQEKYTALAEASARLHLGAFAIRALWKGEWKYYRDEIRAKIAIQKITRPTIQDEAVRLAQALEALEQLSNISYEDAETKLNKFLPELSFLKMMIILATHSHGPTLSTIFSEMKNTYQTYKKHGEPLLYYIFLYQQATLPKNDYDFALFIKNFKIFLGIYERFHTVFLEAKVAGSSLCLGFFTVFILGKPRNNLKTSAMQAFIEEYFSKQQSDTMQKSA